MDKIKYKISARTTLLLGREGVSKADGAIIELIKNTYDADASICLLYFDDIEDRIFILDDGSGMNRFIIENYWMMIGTDNKKHEYQSIKNRVKSGEKGIGRFALDRLGSKCEVYTKTNNDKLIHWINDWNDFEFDGKSLDEVEAQIEELNEDLSSFVPKYLLEIIKKYNSNFISGTMIVISGLRDLWTDDKKNGIMKSLSTVLPPVEQTDFKLLFKYDNKSDFVEIENPYQDNFDYKIEAEFDGENFNIKLHRNEFDISQIPPAFFDDPETISNNITNKNIDDSVLELTYSIEELMAKESKDSDFKNHIKRIGKFKFIYSFMKLTNTSGYYHKKKTELSRNWMKENYGIRIFRDNFAVRPYGDKDGDSSDWLGLDARRRTNPTGSRDYRKSWSVSNNQGQGTLFISRVYNSVIADKSSREGIIENEYFLTLKNVLINIIKVFESDRSNIGYLLAAFHKKNSNIEEIKEEGNKISNDFLKKAEKSNSQLTVKQQQTLAKTVSILSEEKKQLISENNMLRSLATNGLIVTTLLHDLKTIKGCYDNQQIELTLGDLLNNGNKEDLIEFIKNEDDIDKRLIPMIDLIVNQTKKKRDFTEVNLVEKIVDIINTIKPVFSHKNIDLNFDASDNNISKEMFATDLDSIFYNLFMNSMEIFEEKCLIDKKINISIKKDYDEVIIEYKDNGPGISKVFKNPYDILKFGETTKKNKNGEKVGTGLGMYILHSIVTDYKGTVLLPQDEKGFHMVIKLPL